MSLDTRDYIFPRRLSRDYHGPVKPRERLASIHRQKFREQTMQNSNQYNPEQDHLYKVSDILWQTKRLNNDIIRQRNELITNSTRVSKDSPEWFKSTFKYFKQNQMSELSKRIQAERKINRDFDVFNRKRDQYMTIENPRMQSIYKNQSTIVRQRIDFDPQITEKVGHSLGRTHILNNLEGNVSPKVGSTETRDYSIRKPKLKIGSDNFVDTYSVF